MSTYRDRLAALRRTMAENRYDGFVVPLTDEHMSEYVGRYAQRLAWLTGFEGSAASAVVLTGEAGIFVDGRYTLQVRDQVDGTLYEYVGLPGVQIADWLEAKAGPGQRIGFDPWLHTRSWMDATKRRLAVKGADLVSVAGNLVDLVWTDRPAPSAEPFEVHGEALAGQTSAEKRTEIARWLGEKKADCVVVAALDSVAWLFNVRGRDVSRTPVALAFAIVSADGKAQLFTAPAKITPEVAAHLGPDVALLPPEAFVDTLRALGAAGKTVAADPATCVAAIFQALETGGARIVEARDPCILAKAIKNPVEIAGTRAAHVRDGAALSRFLGWFDHEAPKGTLDELAAAAKLEDFRRESNLLKDLSFDTISGAGPNGAIVHYRVSPETNRKVEPDSIFLLDSGGQYLDGTTDVTRTMIVGTPTAEMKDRFTRVLKGHIALAAARFPAGTRGSQLDVLARQFLWQAGLDYAHGTGHGVGSFLSVHEGPQRIVASGGGDEPLAAGMILSNEPGYYKTGAYGIRIENLVLVVPVEVEGAEQPMLAFETLTLAPIDLRLVDTDLLSDAERTWLNTYHARVRDTLTPLLPEDARGWLTEATRAL
ncbi:aminopeptidase P family protein [Sphingosinicella soli]|uniref:Xaa-Pro aminopeptidase n=1 Tax=Sphingosinicella soli TaxID=333708 RepID=A0A7W7B121_9SPHN|nr:aminopeptidase P family protein [Sphingosinicella soli]MBB4632079.1 Xaa-Pro aminopeptidase [Sphingosinicella soli]